MNYGQLRSYFLELLNRDDCTDTQADTFISMGVRRAERLLRTPLQKYIYSFEVPEDFTGEFSVPNDYLGMVELRLDDIPIPRSVGPQVALKDGFTFINGVIKIYLPVSAGSVIALEYYAEFTKTDDPSVFTTYSITVSDLMIYAALVYAADHFMDVRKQDFQMTMTSLASEIQAMADIDAMSGGGMSLMPYGGGIA